MSSQRAKFPGKPVKRFLNGTRTMEDHVSVSYKDRSIDEKVLPAEMVAIEAEIVSRSKIFRDLFGQEDDNNEDGCLGFDQEFANRLKMNHGRIQSEIYSLEVKLQELGVQPSFYKPDVRSSGVNVSSSAVARFSTNSHVSVTKSTTRTLQAAENTTARQTLAASATFTTPLSPLPLRLVSGAMCNIPISGIPIVRYVQDIPTNSGYRSGKFIVEMESDSDSDESDDENVENKFPPVSDLRNQDEPHGTEPEKTLVRLNQCPVGLQDSLEYGFPVIIDKSQRMGPPGPLCFRCGSAGIGQLIFCSSCCEPYHPYCTGHESVLSAYVACIPSISITHSELETKPTSESLSLEHQLNPVSEMKHEISVLSPTFTPSPDQDMEQTKVLELKKMLRTWNCERCYVCYVCKSHDLPSSNSKSCTKDPTFLKCPSCPRVVHANCCPQGVKKGSQKIRLCEQCYKCSSCGKRIERRGNKNDTDQKQLCQVCIRQKKKGSYCPLCSVCYDDDDFDTKMMECARCEHWIHADCENVTAEQYQILSNLPESVEFICRECEDPRSVYWRKAVLSQIESDWKEVLDLFQNRVSVSSRKLRILQPSRENTPVKPNNMHDMTVVPDSLFPAKAPSPSSKENTTVVRQLFSNHSSSSVGALNEKLNEKIRESSLNSTKSKLVDKECFILLQDCQQLSTSPPLLPKQNQKSIALPSTTIEPKVELEVCKTPVKFQPVATIASASKLASSVKDSIIDQLNFPALSVKCIYDKALKFIENLEENDPQCQLKPHFESAFTKVFPWFNSQDYEDVKLWSSGQEAQCTSTTSFKQEVEEEDSFKLQEISNSELRLWNPFEDVRWDKTFQTDPRLCSFCQKAGDSPPDFCGRLLWAGLSEWVHVNCALWSSEVWEDEDGALKQVGVALGRSKGLNCMICGEKGASVSCCVQSCPKSFHFPCALRSSCILLEDKGMFCSEHVSRSKGPRQLDMRVLRQVHVDTDWIRKKDKVLWSDNVAVYIGSLKIDSLGHLAPLSVEKDFDESSLIPLNYEASRVFWSFDTSSSSTSKFPKKLTYSVNTAVKKQEARRSKYCKKLRDINIRVDHTKSQDKIAQQLKQVKAFHDWVYTTPKYIDEYYNEWLYPCGLLFEDTLDSSGSDADMDGEDDDQRSISSAMSLEDDLFRTCVVEAEKEDFDACFDDLIGGNEDWDELDNVSEHIASESKKEAEIRTESDETLVVTDAETTIDDSDKDQDVEIRTESDETVVDTDAEAETGYSDKVEIRTESDETLVDTDAETVIDDANSEVEIRSETDETVVDSDAETVTDDFDYADILEKKATRQVHIEHPYCAVYKYTEEEAYLIRNGSVSEESIADTDAETVIDAFDYADMIEQTSTRRVNATVHVHIEHPYCAVYNYSDEGTYFNRKGSSSEVSIADTDAETVYGDEDDFLDVTPANKIRNYHYRQFLIPQVDGAGDSDSSDDDEDSQSLSSVSSDSDSEGDQRQGSSAAKMDKKQKQAKLSSTRTKGGTNTAKKVLSKHPQDKLSKKSKDVNSSSHKADTSRRDSVYGGRALRSRKKLQEAKLASQKKQEFKCSGCKKDFSSQASLTRHLKFCKHKNSRKKSNKSNQSTVTDTPVPKATSESPKKRGRKPKAAKKKSPTANIVPVVDMLESSSTSSSLPGPSTSRYPGNSFDSYHGTVTHFKGRTDDHDSEMSQDGDTSFDTTEIPIPKDSPVADDAGRVYCVRCKNTYRTSQSYKNHLGNCVVLGISSESDDEEEDLDDEVNRTDEAVLPRPSTFLPLGNYPASIASDDSDTETSDSSESMCDEMTSMSAAIVQNHPINQISTSCSSTIVEVHEDEEVKVLPCDITGLSDAADSVPEEEMLSEAGIPVIDDENNVDYNTGAEVQGNILVDVKEQVLPPPADAEEEHCENEVDQIAEAMSMFASQEEGNAPESESVDTLGQFPDAKSQEPRTPIPYTEHNVNLPPTGTSSSNDYVGETSWNPVSEPPSYPVTNMNELQGFPNQYPRPPLQQELNVPSLPVQNFQNFQTVQPPAFGAAPFQQQFQSPFFQYPNSHQQLQTMTFQDAATGQLITIQVPVMTQQQQVPVVPQQQQGNPAAPHHPTFLHQHSVYNNISQAPPPLPTPHQATEAQYEQYKHQIQTAAHLHRNTLLQHSQHSTSYQNEQHQREILQQQQHIPRAVSHPAGQCENQVYYQSTAQASSTSTSMLMNAVNPVLHQHQQHGLTATGAPRHQQIHQTSEGLATYMVVQQGNTQTLVPADPTMYAHQHQRTYLPANPYPEESQQSLNHAPIVATSPENLQSFQSEQIPGTSHECTRQPTNHKVTNCSCADCLRLPTSFNTVLQMNPPFWTIQKPPAVANVRKQKTGRVRARLASIVSERQGQGLQLFRSMTSPNSTLPKLLPATAAATSTTTTVRKGPSFMNVTEGQALIGDSTDSFKPPQPPTVLTHPLTPAATVTLNSLAAPIVSASTAPTLLKAPTPSPNIAVVRPMEQHPLQKISDQIQQLGSSFTFPSSMNINSQLEVNLNLVAPTTPERPITTDHSVTPNVTHFPIPTAPSPSPTETTMDQVTLPEQHDMPVEPIIPPDTANKEVGDIKKSPSVTPEKPSNPTPEKPTLPNADKTSIKIRLKRQAGGDSYSINKISGSTATSNNQFPGMFKTLKIKGKITTGDQAGTSTDVVVQPVVYTIPIPDPNADGDDEDSNRTIAEDESAEGNESRTCLETSVILPVPSSLELDEKGQPNQTPLRLTHRAVIVYEVKIDDKVQYKSCDVRAVWGYILERVQGTRRNHNLPPLSYPATNISLPENKREAAASFNKLGLTHRAVQFLLEQLPGVKNAAKEGHVFKFQEPPKASIEDSPVVENPTGAARSEGFSGRKPFDMFGWLASKHRQPEVPAVSSRISEKKGGSLPMAMKYRNMIKFGTKHLNVFWSSIHGRGLFTTKEIEAGDVIIEYAGEVIRPVLCDLREKYYESKGIGCYMFRIDDRVVVDATLKGNAARFINHSCDPNCRSKTLEILGKKHILIMALRKIIAGEELTYDYKFEEEGVKLPCSCGTKKCRKFLN